MEHYTLFDHSDHSDRSTEWLNKAADYTLTRSGVYGLAWAEV